MSRLPLPVALVVAVLALAACGGAEDLPDAETVDDPAAAYEEQLRAVDNAVLTASERLADDTFDAAQLETELEEARRRVDQSSPPYEALPPHQRLSQSLGEAVDVSAGLADAEQPYPPAEVEQLREALTDAREALDELVEMGYDVRRRT